MNRPKTRLRHAAPARAGSRGQTRRHVRRIHGVHQRAAARRDRRRHSNSSRSPELRPSGSAFRTEPRVAEWCRGRLDHDRARPGVQRLPLGRRAAARRGRDRVRDELRQRAPVDSRRAQGPAVRAAVPDPPPRPRPGQGSGAAQANARGRTDSTWSPPGRPSGRSESRRTWRSSGGSADAPRISRSPSRAQDDRPVNVEGSGGLRMRFGVEPDALVADIREVERVCREEEPRPGARVHRATSSRSPTPDTRPARRASSRCCSAGTRGWREHAGARRADSVLEAITAQARSFTVRIGSARPSGTRRSTRGHPPADPAAARRARVTALRSGRVTLNADDDGGQDWPTPRPTSGSRPTSPSDARGSS